MDIEFGHIITQILAFMVMLWVLQKFGWVPVMNLLDQRKDFIRNELETIQAEKESIVKLSEEYEDKLRGIEVEARQKIQDAIGEGRKIAEEIHRNAQKEAKETLLKAREELNRDVVQAKNQIKSEVVNLVFATTEKLLDKSIDKATHEKLVEDFVKEADIR